MSFGFGFGFTKITAAIRAAFSPSSLFAANEPGVWYDPSDFSTMFQDAAGTTPVTAVEQPVGLMLDKSQGLVLGPELVTNGDFSNGTTGWAYTVAGTSTALISGGQATLTKGDSYCFITQGGVLTAGKIYQVTLDVVSVTGAGALANNSGVTYATFTTTGTKTFKFRHSDGATNVLFLSANSGVIVYDNISVRELPGNHAYQTTTTSRPVLSARYNLLTKTEDFSDAAWSKTGLNAFGSGSVANSTAITDPLGGNTADFIQENTAAGSHLVYVASFALLAATSYVFSAYVKAGGRTRAQLWLGIASPRIGVIVDLSAGTASAISAVGTGTTTATSISSVGNGWYRVSCTGTLGTAGNYASAIIIDNGSGHTYTGDGTSGIYIWGADLRVANDGVNLPPYQRVNTATDYDTAGFPHYLRFDGIDDWLVTNTITPGIDKVQVFAGVQRLRSASEIIAETGAYAAPGAFYLAAEPTSNRYGYAGWGARVGDPNDQANLNFFPPPDTAILTATQDINGNTPSRMRRNAGAWSNSINTTFGGGNFLAYPLYIGRRGGTTLPFNGHLYSLIVRFGSNLPIETIEKTEKYINTKTRAF